MKNTYRLVSGRVVVKSPEQVAEDRYQFLDLASAEPNLGTAANGSVLTTDVNGQRIWTTDLSIDDLTLSGNLTANVVYTDHLFYANGQPFVTGQSGTVGQNTNIYNGRTTATNAETLIDSFSASGITTVRWILSANDTVNSVYKTSTIDSSNNGTDIYYNEYGIVLSDNSYDVASYTVEIENGNITLYAVGSSISVPITFQRITLGANTVEGFVQAPEYEQSVIGSGTATISEIDSYIGDGSEFEYPLSVPPTDKNQTIVSIGGILQPKATYSISGNILTFSSPPPDGAPVEIQSFVTTTITGYTGSQGVEGGIGYTGSQGFTGSAGALSNWTKKTANYSASNGDRIIADTGDGPFFITLPSSPELGYHVQITDGFNFSVNSLTVLRNGSTIEGQAVDVLIDSAAVDIQFIYDGDSWQIVSTFGPRGYTGSSGTQQGYSGSSGGAGIEGNLYIDGTLTVNNSILPTVSNVIDIGSPTQRFGTLYLAGNTIDLGGAQIKSVEGEVSFETATGNIDLNANLIEFLSSVSVEGPAGAVGFTGSQGITGTIGFTGSQGVGFTGSSGSIAEFTKTYFFEGTLAVDTGIARLFIHKNSVLKTIKVFLGSSGSTNTVISIKRNGINIQTITINSNTTYLELDDLAVNLSENDYLTVDIVTASNATDLYVILIYQ